MNWWIRLPAVKCLALMAALAMPLAPVDLLAFCGCSACGCAAPAEDSLGCCCTGKTHAIGCCETATPISDDCSCTQSAPASPTGTLPDSRTAQDTQTHLAAPALLPPIAPCDSAAQLALSDYEPHQTVPVRILLCVWRN